MDANFKDEISEYPFDPLDHQVNQREELRAQPAQLKRGPVKIEDQWTRVVSLHYDNLTKIHHLAIQNDI